MITNMRYLPAAEAGAHGDPFRDRPVKPAPVAPHAVRCDNIPRGAAAKLCHSIQSGNI
jgi:hypothetical protein